MRAAPAALLLALVLGGCTQDSPGVSAPFLPTREPEMRFTLVSLEHEGAEPTLGVDAQGRVFVISDTSVFRSDDRGATWTDVTPRTNNWPLGSFDPFLHVDRDTGRVFADHLYVGCSYLITTDDAGASWDASPAACGRPGNDHQSLTTGKPVRVATRGYANVVYYAYNDVAPLGLGALDGPRATSVARSLDGGLTWEPGVVAITGSDCGGLNGHAVTAPDGTVYVPAAGCDEPVVAVSRDSGASWEVARIDTAGRGRSAPGDDPSVAVDAAGNAYLVWPTKDARMAGAVSRDDGRTWGPAFDVSPPHVTSSLMPTSVAGSAGRVAFAYYATKDSTEGWASVNSGDADDDTRWHVFVTYALDALAVSPRWTTVQVTPDDDPIQVGSIHNGGGNAPDRNLLDFFDAAIDPAGRLFVAYTDGCAGCASPQESRRATTTVAAQAEGPRLVAAS